MRFPLRAAGLACACAIVSAASAQDGNAPVVPGATVIGIGLSGPLTGPQAAVGKDDEAGAQMAIEELNRKKPTIGGKPVVFRLFSEDDQANPKTGVAVAHKLIDAKVKAVLGPYNSDVAIAVSKLYNDAAIVVAAFGTNPRITQQGFQYVFRLAANDNQIGGDMAAYAARQLKLKKVAVIDDRTVYGQGVADAFLAAAKSARIGLANRKFSTDNPSEFGAILTAIKGQQVDGIFYGGYFTQAVALKRQMQQAGIQAVLMGGDGICNAQAGRLGGALVNDRIYCARGGSALGARMAEKTFLAGFRQQFGQPPLTWAPYLYDGVKMIAAAMQKADSLDPLQFTPVLASMRYSGVVGEYAFDDAHDLKNTPVTIYQFRNGEPVAMPVN